MGSGGPEALGGPKGFGRLKRGFSGFKGAQRVRPARRPRLTQFRVWGLLGGSEGLSTQLMKGDN